MTFLQDAWHFSYMYLYTFQLMGNVSNISKHGLIQDIDTKAKCHHLKKLTCKGTLLQVFIREFIDWRYSPSCWYFRPSFVSCCPSPLLSGLTLSPPTLLCVNKFTVYTYTVC
jgi:hypothetical protein